MATKRLQKGKGIKVRSEYFDGDGELVRSYKLPGHPDGPTEYEIRIGPAHFIYMRRKDFELVDTVIKFDTLVKLRQK